MFGKLRSILDAFPNYIVDYREYGRNVSEEERWDDRVTIDFSWPGNLFSFCRIVLPRLYQSLKVPFRTKSGVRIDESPVHIALREALVNTIIHADYGEGGAILVTAFAEEEVSHARLMELCKEHQADVSRALRNLVQNGFLESEGHGRGTVYWPAGFRQGGFSSSVENKNESAERKSSQDPRLTEKGPRLTEKGPSSGPSSVEKGPSSLSSDPGTFSGRLNKGKRECLLLLLEEILSASELRRRLSRANASKFRTGILKPLLDAKLIEPTKTPPQHPQQQYRITDFGREAIHEGASRP